MFKIPENLDSKYRFVILSALRAEQLQVGAIPRVKATSHKPTVIAQQEVAEGLVGEWDPNQEVPVDEAVEMQEE